MSVDISWETLTGGPDGASREEAIRAFVHDRFQQVALPRFIRSVHVHSFQFGDVPPEIELKDICDPLPDFYEEDEDDEDDEDDDEADETKEDGPPSDIPDHPISQGLNQRRQDTNLPSSSGTPAAIHQHAPPPLDLRSSAKRTSAYQDYQGHAHPPTSATPGIPGGTSNLSYFHLPLGAGLSGTTTPLAAVAGAHFQGGRQDLHHHAPVDQEGVGHNRTTSSSSLTPPSSADPPSRPTSRHRSDASRKPSRMDLEDVLTQDQSATPVTPAPPLRLRESSPDDVQIVSHVKYSGNVKLSLTAEILLDYPMPSFVGIPLKLNITGLTFDGVAILAYIRKRAHFCFLSPEDADTLVGHSNSLDDSDEGASEDKNASTRNHVGGLLEEIRVESEIGQKETGKQVLKNVGKVEKFVLEQVRRIFEDEFVYPSFWTFLV
ncbi:mitochondrial distribution and morphology protein 12 [Aulographum hederae CBS 113979]|uniref:Mitochondrial distribution and morphology protein 12 n=1 Tax=Aulographum hederae CBS 113979 TaxID=1176131 RepID=A0A6G1H689_9PEZI|nr:mitochondrial distribution and morphology protein 12 [Aulographum hederae CBS 113979]